MKRRCCLVSFSNWLRFSLHHNQGSQSTVPKWGTNIQWVAAVGSIRPLGSEVTLIWYHWKKTTSRWSQLGINIKTSNFEAECEFSKPLIIMLQKVKRNKNRQKTQSQKKKKAQSLFFWWTSKFARATNTGGLWKHNFSYASVCWDYVNTRSLTVDLLQPAPCFPSRGLGNAWCNEVILASPTAGRERLK